MNDAQVQHCLKRLVAGQSISEEESADVFGAVMSGAISEAAIASLLTALAMRRPTVDEIVGAARAMRATMKIVETPPGAIDLCGTGGDGAGTLNISTACAFVVAGAGVAVAKHGNRNMSSKSGAADVLEALGARIDVEANTAKTCLQTANVCFLFAQSYHPAMKHAAPVRRALGFRTIFNLLGPLASPGRVTRQLVGVFEGYWLEPVAEALRRLGIERAWVVHGTDGLDEITTTGATHVAVLENGDIKRRTVSPEEVGLRRARLEDIAGGNVSENAAAIRALMAGAKGAYRDIVLLNSAAALVVAGKATDLRGGVVLAEQSLDSGRAGATLNRFIAASRQP